ncbi:MAG: HD domain-containing phosphohydrolase [Desulfobacterales bacterium]
MTERILFVDDEPNVLSAIKRQLGGKFRIDTATEPEQGLKALAENGSYAVVVSDLRMPIMDGIQFLSKVRKLSPNIIRMMLTGNADLSTAIKAVNEGSVFQFLTKPCGENELSNALKNGLHQYRLITAEKELLEKTLKGGIEVMTDLLSMANPAAFGRSLRISHLVKEIASRLNISDVWQLETGAMLSQLGWFLLPAHTLRKVSEGRDLTADEKKTLDMNPMISADLIKNIPRMEKVAEIILYQDKCFDGSGQPDDKRRGESIPLGSRILKVALDFDLLESKGITRADALTRMHANAGRYDPEVMKALKDLIGIEDDYQVREVAVAGLRANMILDQDVWSLKGQLLISKGRALNSVALKRLRHFDQNSGIQEPIRVLVSVYSQEDISITDKVT